MNNAIEAAKESYGKIVELVIEQDFSKAEDKYIVTIKNTVKDSKKINILSMFKVRFSSKGKDRGYGLSNVQRIVKENGGDIIIGFMNDMMVVEIHV